MTAMISDSCPAARGRMTPQERVAGREVVRGREAEQKVIRDLLVCAQRGAGGVVVRALASTSDEKVPREYAATLALDDGEEVADIFYRAKQYAH
jgi:hypothetical protein